MATTANAPGETSSPGNRCVIAAPNKLPYPALISRIGASVPPDVPEPSAAHHASSFAEREHCDRADRELVGQHVADGVVSHAERPRHEETDRREDHRADHRVPELADGQPPIPALDREQAPTDDRREQAAPAPSTMNAGSTESPA